MTTPAPTTSTPAANTVLTVHPDSIKVGKRFRKDLGNIDALVESIREVGLLHRVVIDAHFNLIAGERRLAACVRLGWRSIPATFVELDAEKTLRAQDDENAIRKDFTPTEAVAIRDARLAREKEKAKAREEAGTVPKDKLSKGRARDKAAAGTGYSGQTVDKAAAVVFAAAADPTLLPVVEEMDRTGKVDPAYQKVTVKVASCESRVAKQRRLAGEKAARTHNRNRILALQEAWAADPERNERARAALVEAIRLMDGLTFWEDGRLRLEAMLTAVDMVMVLDLNDPAAVGNDIVTPPTPTPTAKPKGTS